MPKPSWFLRLWRGWRVIAWSLLLVSFSLVYAPASQAATQPTTVQVATRLIPPFVLQDQGKLTGFSLDLWQKIVEQTGMQSNITVYSNLPQMMSAIDEKKADLAIAAISITADRNQKYDFSLPIFNSGLQILVRKSTRSGGLMPNILRDLLSPALLQIVGLAVIMVVVSSHIIWLLERRHPSSSISNQYFPGIFEAAWWSASTLATQAEEMPKGPSGRVMAICWMFVSVVFVAYFTATVTTGMTVQQLQGDINSLNDLQGRIAATTKGSTTADFLREQRIQTLEVDKIEDAYGALQSQKVDAVVFDSPVLMYYASHAGEGNVQVVGELFREENYGVLLPANSKLRKPIDTALLKLKENGTYQAVYDRWFKTKPAG